VKIQLSLYDGWEGGDVKGLGKASEKFNMGGVMDSNISLTCSALDNQCMKPVESPFRLTTKLEGDTYIKGVTFGCDCPDLPALSLNKKQDYFTKYADEGIENLESPDVLKVRPMTLFGSPIEILREFGEGAVFGGGASQYERQAYLSNKFKNENDEQ